jgi:protein-L-isoaspartate(D-aspartate) O-methyltransferase
MGAVPREAFVPKHLRGVAYNDEDLQLGDGRRLIEPLALAKLLQAAAPGASEVGLVIGCDTGYAATVLARLMATVFVVSPTQQEVERLESLLGSQGADNVIAAVAPWDAGLPDQAPFDVILLAGAVEEVPSGLLAQLSDHGRLAAVVREGRAGRVTVWTRIGDSYGRTAPFDASIPPIPGATRRDAFVF